MDFPTVTDAVARTGLIARGAFRPGPEDGVPDMNNVGTLVVIGNAGSAMWRAFAAAGPHAPDHPLDRWTRRVLDPVAKALGAKAYFPFHPAPNGGFLPFLRWAQRAEAVFPSPMGPMIHPDYGLWHAYRGAFAFKEAFDPPPRDARPSPCETCAEKPCLTSCPVDAFNGRRYDVSACIRHLVGPAGEDCVGLGCRARRACPVGRDYLYEPAQARFHMARFLAGNRKALGI